MYLLLTDETNLEASAAARFFAYGGLFLPVENIGAVHAGVEEIRARAGFRPGDIFKFETRSRPEHVTHENVNRAKGEVIELCRAQGCKFIAYVVLHDIAKNQARDVRLLYGFNTVLRQFQVFLRRTNEQGMVLADTLPVEGPNQYLREKFSVGLTYGNGPAQPLDRIVLFGQTCLGASHLASAIDIVLGAFRYVINEPKNKELAGDLTVNVCDLMWGERKGDTLRVLEAGLVLRPMLQKITHDGYRQEYEALLARIGAMDDAGMARRAAQGAAE